MKHIVSVSGGLSSAITLDLVIEKHGIENTVAVFCDTKTEDIDLYRFNTDIQNKYKDLEWITLCDGRDIWQLFSEKNFHGNSKIAPCSNILKQDIFRKWLVSSYPNHEEVIIYLGIGFDEMHRCKAIDANTLPYLTSYPLIDWLRLMPSQKLEYFSDIEPPRLYKYGFSHNNCGGCCVKSGQAQMKLLFESLPEQYLYHEQRQQEILDANPKLRPFIKIRANYVYTYLSLREFREQYLEEKSDAIDQSDFGSCGCFVDYQDSEKNEQE